MTVSIVQQSEVRGDLGGTTPPFDTALLWNGQWGFGSLTSPGNRLIMFAWSQTANWNNINIEIPAGWTLVATRDCSRNSDKGGTEAILTKVVTQALTSEPAALPLYHDPANVSLTQISTIFEVTPCLIETVLSGQAGTTADNPGPTSLDLGAMTSAAGGLAFVQYVMGAGGSSDFAIPTFPTGYTARVIGGGTNFGHGVIGNPPHWWDGPQAWVGSKTIAAGAEHPIWTSDGWAFTEVGGITLILATTQPSAPRGLSGAPEYVVELLDSDAAFGPRTKLGEIWDLRNLGWSNYDRIPGKAFFTVSQLSSFAGESIAGALRPLLTHVNIWRITPTADILVYRGAFIDYNSTGDDIICSCFDYKALLSISRTGYKTLYPSKKIGSEIVTPEWAAARGATSSPLGFVATGTIQDPLGTDNVTPITSSPGFGTLDQNRLQFFYDLSEIGRANTVNQTTFDIDLTNTFSFVRNAGSASSFALILGGKVSDYQYLPNWTAYRNELATLGTTTTGGTAEITANVAAEVAAKGLRQDVTTLKTLMGIVGAATEGDQQQAALKRAVRNSSQLEPVLSVRLVRGLVEPFVGWSMNDTVAVEINNGFDNLVIPKRIVGVRVFFDESGEDTSLILQPVVTA